MEEAEIMVPQVQVGQVLLEAPEGDTSTRNKYEADPNLSAFAKRQKAGTLHAAQVPIEPQTVDFDPILFFNHRQLQPNSKY